jgi:hypothetical protein
MTGLRHLMRCGRHWVNPRYIVRVEDLTRPQSDAGDPVLCLVVARGEHISLSGDDAAELRRVLLETTGGLAAVESAAEACPMPGFPARPPDSGHSFEPRVRPFGRGGESGLAE